MSCPASAAPAPGPSPEAPAAEFRAFWVDGHNPGFRTPEEAAQLVADAKRANINVLIVQVRRVGDAFYTKSIEPPAEDPAYGPKFDALGHLIELAHREGIEVHAWVNAMPIWRGNAPPPVAPNHIFNLHGVGHTGEDNWLTAAPTGEERFPVGYFLDPGHPAAAAHIVKVFLNLVRQYPLDGIHFDYIRYPESGESTARGAPAGYNSTALARFRRATGRTDTPAPDDPQWIEWRRQQVTQLVRHIYLEAKAINPRIRVSAALVAWGRPPKSEKDFEDAVPAQRVFQDWNRWLREGILDLAIPMNYVRESDVTGREWSNGWIHWEKRYKHGRLLAIGLGAYLNSPQDTLVQVRRARKPESRRRAEGVSFFSYAHMLAPPQTDTPAAEASGRAAFLVVGAPPEAPVFGRPAAVPRMEWIDQPTRGLLAGVVRDAQGQPVDGARVRVKPAGWSLFARAQLLVADGNGFFGLTNLKPGRYRVRYEPTGARASEVVVEVVAGRVARADLEAR